MPLSAADKTKAKRLLLIASILTDYSLGKKLDVDPPFLADLADAITKDVTDATGRVIISGLNFDRDYITGVGSDGRQAIEKLKLVASAAKAVAGTLEDAFYTDPDQHRDFINALLAELGV